MANYGQFTDYEPLPGLPGAYSFKMANGRDLVMGDKEGAQLKMRLDAARAATATAGNGMAGGFDQAPPPPGASFDAKAAAGELTGAAAAAPAPPTAEAGPPPPPGGAVGYGLRVSPQGTFQHHVAGSAGVSKEQLQKADENAVAVRRGETAQVQEGTPQSQEYLDARAEQNIDQRLALQQQGDRDAAAAQAESDLAQRQFEEAQRLKIEEAARQASLEEKLKREEELHQKAVTEHTSSKVEPGRIYADPAKRFVTALAAAGGAYAATITKTPNFAQQIIEQSIDRDIAAQEAAIRLKGVKADNLLARLRQTGMSVAQSQATAKVIQLQNSQTESAALRAKNAMPALQSHYENLDLALQKSLLEANEQSRLASIDKVARSTQSGFEHERAGSAGGWVDVKDQLGTAKELQGLQKGEAEIAKSAAETAKTNREGQKPPPASPELRKVDQTLAALSSDQERLKGYGDEEKPKTFANRGVIMKGIINDTNKWLGEGSYESTYNDKEKNFIQDFESAKGNLVAAISVANQQGAMQEGERKEAEKKIAAAGSVGELKRAQAWVRDRLEKQRSAAAANTGPAMEVTK
jgi:hypothetical protein